MASTCQAAARTPASSLRRIARPQTAEPVPERAVAAVVPTGERAEELGVAETGLRVVGAEELRVVETELGVEELGVARAPEAERELMTYQLFRSISLSQQIDSRLFDVQPEVVHVGKELREIRHAWNLWGNFQFGSRDDQRFGQDLSAKVYGVTVGFDRTFGDRAVAGIAIGGQWMGLDSYKDSLQINSSGLVVGPYAAVEITPHWVIDAWTGYIYDAFENDLSILSGDYDASRFFVAFNITANYDLGWFALRPKTGSTTATVGLAHSITT